LSAHKQGTSHRRKFGEIAIHPHIYHTHGVGQIAWKDMRQQQQQPHSHMSSILDHLMSQIGWTDVIRLNISLTILDDVRNSGVETSWPQQGKAHH
jgi:hypothetical protein